MREILRFAFGILVHLVKLLGLMLAVDLLGAAVFWFVMPEASMDEAIVAVLVTIILLATSWLIPPIKRFYLSIDKTLERKGFFRWIFRTLD